MLHFRLSNSDGVDKPALVLIHGLFGSLENLGGIARLFTPFYSVYSLDLPNHGRSSHVSDCSLESMANTVSDWMSEQGLNSAYFLGHSLGGKVAMELALKYPSKVKKLAVIDIAPVNYPPRHNDVFAGLLAINPASLLSRAEADTILREYVSESAVRTFLLKNLAKVGGVFQWRMNLDDLHQNYGDLISSNRTACYEGDTLFVKGGDSDYIKEGHRADITQRFPNAQLRIVANTGHWLHAEKPEIVAKLVLRFMSASI